MTLPDDLATLGFIRVDSNGEYYLDLTYADKLVYYHDTRVIVFELSIGTDELSMSTHEFAEKLYEVLSDKVHSCRISSYSDSSMHEVVSTYCLCMIEDICSADDLVSVSAMMNNRNLSSVRGSSTINGVVRIIDNYHRTDDEFISRAVNEYWNNYFMDKVVIIYLND